VIGRLQAIDALKKKKDKKTVSKLKDVLNNDPFYGVRNKASAALREIHNDEAFNGLTESMDQPDARVRLQVVNDIGGFYRPESFELMKQVLNREKTLEFSVRRFVISEDIITKTRGGWSSITLNRNLIATNWPTQRCRPSAC